MTRVEDINMVMANAVSERGVSCVIFTTNLTLMLYIDRDRLEAACLPSETGIKNLSLLPENTSLQS